MAFDPELVREVKQRADIVDVISFYLPSVQKKSKNYVAVCPFHDDHDPSMQINKEKQTFHCFVCQSGGDVFTFVQKYDKCSFEEALRKVCDIIGFDDPRLHKQTYVKKIDENLVPIYNCINELQNYYVYALTTEEGKIARDYLDSRKLSLEQCSRFGVGYSFKDGTMTVEYLKAKGYSLKNIENTGICYADTSSMHDNNQGRLIFPIKDNNGQVCGFSARKIDNDPNAAKYVNSPETKIFTKGNILYNFWQAKQTIKHDGYVYIVEGFMDVFALDSIGITSCVALMSTKLTPQHIETLRKTGVELRICLDGDKPGQSAMMKLMSQLDEAKLPYRLVSKPGELRDPDEILKQDGEDALRNFVNSLVDPLEFSLNFYQNTSPLNTIEDKKNLIKKFIPKIASFTDQLMIDDYIAKLSKTTGFAESAIRNSIKDYKNKLRGKKEEITNVNEVLRTDFDIHKMSRELRRLILAERTVLDLMFISDEAISFYENNIKYFYNEVYRTIANYLIEQYKNDNSMDASKIIDVIQSSDIKNKDELINELSAISFRKDTTKYSKQTLKDCSEIIEVERTRAYQKSAMKKALEGKSAQEQAKIVAEYLENIK